MEKDQIIKALECCIKNERENTAKYCENCPSAYAEYGDEVMCCIDGMCASALALIRSQDEQIFQLENRLKECENGYAGTLHLERNKLHDAEEKVKELTEENERLKTKIVEENKLLNDRVIESVNAVSKAHQRYTDALEENLKTIKADTVREMQERFKELMGGEFASCGYCNAVGYWSVKAVKDNIDHIANEILNEKTEEEKK